MCLCHGKCFLKLKHMNLVESWIGYLLGTTIFHFCNEKMGLHCYRAVADDDISLLTKKTLRQKMHPCWFCNNLLKLRSSMPTFRNEFVTKRCKNVAFADQVFFTIRNSINMSKIAQQLWDKKTECKFHNKLLLKMLSFGFDTCIKANLPLVSALSVTLC